MPSTAKKLTDALLSQGNPLPILVTMLKMYVRFGDKAILGDFRQVKTPPKNVGYL